MGCFPYLGFFSEKDALEHANLLQTQNWVTYVRPVYAYSTLGYFEDNILSSFFKYDDEALAEMIFHELFHTIFFIKGEVDFNEALATYFSKEMVFDYFKVDPKDKLERLEKAQKRKKLNKKIVELTKRLNKNFKQKNFEKKEVASIYFDNFMKEQFYPEVESKCLELKVSYCYPLKRKWNNASLAAFLTYEKKNISFEKLRISLSLNLIDFYKYIENKYEKYQKQKDKVSFSDQLFKPIL